MRIYRTEMITREKQVLEKMVCDLCGRKADGGSWPADRYEMGETEIRVIIEQREGTNYPEGGWGTKFEIDVCPQCFKEKLIPWLRSQGAKIEETEWEW